MKNKMTFEQWMQLVDKEINNLTGLSSSDLVDCCYRDWYDDGVNPRAAARRAIKNSE